MTTLAPNTLIHGRYRIVQLIGQGGMGAVYEALDTRLSSRVALKQMLVGGAHLERAFENEAKLLANLRHPALPRVIDYFSDPAGQFLVMDFVDGNDLAAMLARRGAPFTVAESARISAQLLGALSYLHGQQPPILHRDIKPQNIKLNAQGDVMLLDFGLAKGSAAYTAHILSMSSLIGYTPHYAPLEQIRGSGTSPRSDLYALAATFYHLLTGTAPADALSRATEILRGQPDPLLSASDINPSVPQALSAALRQALSLNPSERPASAAEMRRMLSALQLGAAPPMPANTIGATSVAAAPQPAAPTELATAAAAPQPAAPTQMATQLGPTIPVNQSVSTVPAPAQPQIGSAHGVGWIPIVAAFLLLAGLFGLTVLFQSNAFQPTVPTAPAIAHATVAPTVLPTAAPVSTVTPDVPTAAPASTVTPDVPTAAPQSSLPALAGRIVFTSNRDGNEEIYVMNADGSNQTRLTNNPGNDYIPAWSPDGQQIAFSSGRDGNYEIYVMNADGSNQTRLTNSPFDDIGPAWSPDGQQIAFTSERDGTDSIYVMNADGSNQTPLTINSPWNSDVAWSLDGQQIAFASRRDGNYEIYVMNADGSNQTPLTHDPDNDNGPGWSPDGSQIAFTSNRDGNFEIYVMNADGSNQTRLTHAPDDDFGRAWSPDGRQIAFSSRRDGNKEIYVMNADGSQQTRLTNNLDDDGWPSWSPSER